MLCLVYVRLWALAISNPEVWCALLQVMNGYLMVRGLKTDCIQAVGRRATIAKDVALFTIERRRCVDDVSKRLEYMGEKSKKTKLNYNKGCSREDF